ncbi:hypothetical protein SAMN05660297_02485 [Natronincola peptidivorans]|uniref:Uncharacterized protein n=1 Tax=Natronincola peptidivorans TaxID=426128 RepID=A0A1I0EN75_9FIRM|nr:hypothetical protein [Natronincola peptidivorans]SET46440.1 hypothetical protein SAMN05660297_02485 [Natronincola peptidivorans]
MKGSIAVVLWPNSGKSVTIGEALAFVEDDRFFIEIDDGKDLTCGVKIR